MSLLFSFEGSFVIRNHDQKDELSVNEKNIKKFWCSVIMTEDGKQAEGYWPATTHIYTWNSSMNSSMSLTWLAENEWAALAS